MSQTVGLVAVVTVDTDLRGLSGAGVGSQFRHCAKISSNSAFERDWPISVLFAACGF